MDIHHKISSSIHKIKTDWERSEQSGQGISRIDKDILTEDLRRLYDLVFELEISSVSTGKVVDKSFPEAESYRPEVVKTPIRQEQIQKMSQIQINDIVEEDNIRQDVKQAQKPEEVELEIVEYDAPANIEETKVFTEDIDEKSTDSKGASTNQETTKETPDNYLPEKSVKTQATEIDTSTHKPAKSTSEKFHAPKTFADIYQKNGDNSLATKIQKNSISDIKSAIGINDKFLFINEIFKGNSESYHQAIETINNFNHFHEALDYIENLSVENKIENPEAVKDLIEIVKRKFR